MMRTRLYKFSIAVFFAGCGPQSVGSLDEPTGGSTDAPASGDATGITTTLDEPLNLGDAASSDGMTTGTGSDGTTGDATTTGTTGCEDCSALQVSAGANLTCAVVTGGRVRCWGLGDQGALGLASTERIGDDEPPSSAPDVDVGGAVAEVAAGGGGAGACARLVDGAVRCWGYDQNFTGILGQMNPATIGDDESPADVPPIDLGGPATQVSFGGHACALLRGGAVRCWGYNADGRLGYGHTEDIGDDETPASAGDVAVGDAVLALAVGGTHTCALLPRGRVRCWGAGQDGQLGHGVVDPFGPPEHSWIGDDETPASMGDVPVGGAVVQLAAGSFHTCALLDTGGVRCWGANSFGALGHNLQHHDDIGDDETPASIGDVPIGVPAIQVAAGGSHSCALLATGAVRCWGDNAYGQLGQGHMERLTAAEAPDIDLGGPATAIHASYDESCAVLVDGSLRCWGRNVWGELGQGHTEHIGDDETPAQAGPIPLL